MALAVALFITSLTACEAMRQAGNDAANQQKQQDGGGGGSGGGGY
jgi:hypothetical protein